MKIRFGICFILILTMMSWTSLYAQSIFGKVTALDHTPLSFANIALLNATDSTLISRTVSTADGSFSITTSCENGWLRISSIGYQTLYVPAHQGDMGTLQLSPNDKTIGKVTVTGSHIRHKGDKDIVWITSDMRRGKNNTGEMLGNVPGVQYNRMTKSLSYYGEEHIVLLVDSVEKDRAYIQRLNPVRFDRIDIIPYPKGKYEGYTAVINLHTRPNYEGYEGTVGTDTEWFPSNRKIDGKILSTISENGSWTYTRNKWNFFMNYDGSFDRSMRENLSVVTYPMNHYQEEVIGLAHHPKNEKEYERNHVLTGGIDYQFNKRHSLSLAYRLGRENNDVDYHKQVVQTYSALTDTIQTHRHTDNKGFAHTLAAFYRGGFGAWNYTTDVNVVFTNADTHNGLQKSSGYVNQDNRHNHMNHTLARAEMNRHFLQGRLYMAFGYNNFWKNYEQTRLSTSARLTDYTLRQNKLWLYTSYYLSPKTSFYVAASLIHNHTKSSGQKDNYLSYDAKCGLFQNLGNNRWLRFNYQCEVSNPNITQVTEYGQFTDSLQWVGGNPMLRSSLTHDLDLRFQFCKWLSFMAKYKYQPRTFNDITELRQGQLENGTPSYYAATTPQNTRYQNLWLGLYYWQRFKNLTLSADWYFRYAQGKYKSYQNSIHYWHGNCTAEYYWERPQLNLSASYNLSIDYDAWAQGTSKNQVDMLWVYLSKNFCKDRLEFSFTYVLPVHFTSGDNYRKINTPALNAQYNNYSLNRLSNHNFSIGLTYRFSGGKSVREYQREMSNEK